MTVEQSRPYYGFTTQTESDRLRSLTPEKAQNYLENQLMSMLLHVSRNVAVSSVYSYWLNGEDKIFSDPEHAVPMKIDPLERGGFYNSGIHKTLKQAKDHPYQVQLLYSPPGPASFDENPPVEYATPYKIGQLYLVWSNGQSIDNIAISTSKEIEPLIEQIFGEGFIRNLPDNIDKEDIGKIIYWITNPKNTNMTVSEFMTYLQDLIPQDEILFQSNSSMGERNYTIETIIQEIGQSFNGTLGSDFTDHARKLASDFIHGRASHEDIYHNVFLIDGRMQGKTQWALGGACGGTVINTSDLSGSNLFKQNAPEVSFGIGGPLSSVYRSNVQSGGTDSYSREGSEVCVTCPYCQNKNHNTQRSDGTYVCGDPSCPSNRKN